MSEPALYITNNSSSVKFRSTAHPYSYDIAAATSSDVKSVEQYSSDLLSQYLFPVGSV